MKTNKGDENKEHERRELGTSGKGKMDQGKLKGAQ